MSKHEWKDATNEKQCNEDGSYWLEERCRRCNLKRSLWVDGTVRDRLAWGMGWLYEVGFGDSIAATFNEPDCSEWAMKAALR